MGLSRSFYLQLIVKLGILLCTYFTFPVSWGKGAPPLRLPFSHSLKKNLPPRPVHTYSIVARDPNTGEMGVAVQSHWFSIGTLVPWGKAGVGVIATQSFIETRYGSTGLKMMEDGWSAPQTLKSLVTADPHPEIRQVAMIDHQGRVNSHTGKNCIRFASHRIGKGYSVQANLMIRKGVPEAMEQAFLNAKGPLAERLLQALEAAQKIGGDLRGKQSAAILVVSGRTDLNQPMSGRLVDLHVEDNPEPLKELRRLYQLHQAYEHMNNGDLAIEEGNIDKALSEYGSAEKMFPDNAEMKFWHAVSLVNANKVNLSLPLFEEVFKSDANWVQLIPRLSTAKVITATPTTLRKIKAVAPKATH